MSVLSSLGKLVKAIITKVLSFLKKILKKLWPLLLVIGLIYFAPVITGWLTTIGAPSFLTSVFSALSTITPYVSSVLSWIGGGASSIASTAWTAFKGAEFSTQAAVVLGASAMIAPEETAEVVEDVVETAGSLVGTALSSVVSAVAKSPALLVALGFGAWMLLGGRRQQGPLFIGGVAEEKQRRAGRTYEGVAATVDKDERSATVPAAEPVYI